MAIWSEEKNLEFATLYEENPILWDSTRKDYHDTEKIYQTIASISDKMNVTESDIIHKIQKLKHKDKRIKTLRRELEGWREVLCAAHSVLIWEKQYYPIISISAVTTLFLMIWYIEPSVLTLISVFGIITTVCDYLVPQIVPWIVGAHHWTGAHERRYEQIITSLASVCGMASYVSLTLKSMKESKPRTYFVVVTGGLVLCAWIGSTINNLLLTYLIGLVIVLLPGLKHHGILKKYFSTAIQTVANMMKSSVGAVQAGKTSSDGEVKKKD